MCQFEINTSRREREVNLRLVIRTEQLIKIKKTFSLFLSD